MRRLILTFVALFISLVFGLVHAQGVAKKNESAQEIDLNLDQVSLRVLIDTVSEITGKNFIIDPKVKAKVSIVSGSSLNKEQLYDVFLSVLEVNNYAAVEAGGIVKIVPSNLVKQKAIPTQFDTQSALLAQDRPAEEQITQIIKIEHTPVQDLVPVLRPLMPPSSHFATHAPSNSIILTDVAPNIKRVLEIVRRLDSAETQSSLRVIYLKHTKATDIASVLQATFIDKKDAAKQAAPGGASSSVQTLAAINALIINAPNDVYSKMQALIAELDIERSLESDVSVIALKHAKAPELVTILNDNSATNKDSVQSVSVQADEATNSLIVKASGKKLKDLKAVIEQLDVRREQVFVEAIIAEVSLDQAANLGLEWNVGDSDNPVRLIDKDSRTQIGAFTGGTDFNLQTSGFNYSLIDFKKYNLNILLNALRSDVNTNVLSTPTILSLENEEAEIVVGQEVPFITGRFDNTNSTNNNNQFQTIERKDVGIKLKIKAQINEGNTIRLDVGQEISSVNTSTIQGQADLITNQRSIETVVEVDDGQVVVLGGLIQGDYSDSKEWVPFLGKIPLIGYLFRNKSKTVVQRNLMVFLKPRIVRNPNELVGFSKEKYERVRQAGVKQKKKANKDVLINGSGLPILNSYEDAVEKGEIMRDIRQKKIIEDTQNQSETQPESQKEE